MRLVAHLYSTLNQTKIGYRLIHLLNNVLKNLKLTRFVAYPIKGLPFHGLIVKQPDYAYNEYEPDVARCIASLVKEGWHSADIGAHQGIFTLLCARLSGTNGHTFAVEAHPENAQKIKENVRLNKLDGRVSVVNKAVTDRANEDITLYHGRGNASEEWNIIGHDLKGTISREETLVKTTTIDKLFNNKEHVDFIKIDIEGAEGHALKGAEKTIRTVRPIFLIEFHDEENWHMNTLLVNQGYLLYDMNGREIPAHASRVYHCLAIPHEKI